jgi:hypothetical protein
MYNIACYQYVMFFILPAIKDESRGFQWKSRLPGTGNLMAAMT